MEQLSKVTELAPTLGLDLGDRRSHFCRIDLGGRIVEEGSVATDRRSVGDLFGRLAPIRVVVEACGHVHWVSALAREAGHEVIVANPRELRLISNSGRKNDRNDACTLARLGRVDPMLLRPVRLRGDACRASRALLHARDQLVRTRTKLVNFARGQIKTFGGRAPKGSATSFHKRAALQVPEPLRDVLGPLIEVLTKLETEIRGYDRRIEQVAAERHPQTQVLRQVRGVGPVLSLAYVATIEDPARFASSRTVGSYLGLVPELRESGSKTPELGISHRGDCLLRRLLVSAAAYILGPFGEDSDLRRFGERIARGGSQRDRARARIAVARKLACTLHHLWRTGSVWNPNHATASR
jgi:transposase